VALTDFREGLGEVSSSGKLPLDVLALVVPEPVREGLEGRSPLPGRMIFPSFSFWSAQLRTAAFEN